MQKFFFEFSKNFEKNFKNFQKFSNKKFQKFFENFKKISKIFRIVSHFALHKGGFPMQKIIDQFKYYRNRMMWGFITGNFEHYM